MASRAARKEVTVKSNSSSVEKLERLGRCMKRQICVQIATVISNWDGFKSKIVRIGK